MTGPKKGKIPRKPVSKAQLLDKIRMEHMKRTVDVNSVVTQIRALEGSINTVVTQYQTYHAEVAASVKTILETAGVWDEVHAMELEREKIRQQADQKIQGMRAEMEKLAQVHTWLLNQKGEEEDLPATPAKAPFKPKLISKETSPEDEGPIAPQPKETTLEEDSPEEPTVTPTVAPPIPEAPSGKKRPTPPAW
jgi:uncharacterized phage infection (PIP) family protein YhgE